MSGRWPRKLLSQSLGRQWEEKETPSALDEALARYSDSREVPRSVLKCETVFGTLDAISKFPDIPVSLERNTEVPGTT